MFLVKSCTQLIHCLDPHKKVKPRNLHDEVECYVNAVLVTLPASDQRLVDKYSELKSDDTLKTVMQYVQNGWPEEKRRVHGPIAKYWSERGSISLQSGLPLRGRLIIIPPKLRADVKKLLFVLTHWGLKRISLVLQHDSGF